MLMGRARLAVHLQVVRSLKQLESESFGNGAVVEVRDVDYNLLGLEEQIKNDLETDVMVRSRLGCCDVHSDVQGFVVWRACCLVVSGVFSVGVDFFPLDGVVTPAGR